MLDLEVMEKAAPIVAIEAEEYVAGAILRNGSDAIVLAAPILQTDDFYRSTVQEIYSAALELYENNKSIDPLSVSQVLSNRSMLDAIGGMEYLEKLVQRCFDGRNIETHAETVKDKAVRRRLIAAHIEGIRNAYREDKDIETVVAEASSAVDDAQGIIVDEDFEDSETLVTDYKTRLGELLDHKDHLTGVPSGIKALDELTLGFQKSTFVVVAALSGGGKTALALNFFKNAAAATKPDGTNYRPALLSLEMERDELMERLVGSEAKINTQLLRQPYKLSANEKIDVDKALDTIKNMSLWITDKQSMNIVEIRSKVKRLHRRSPIDILFIDYIGLIEGVPGKKYENRQVEVSDIAVRLRRLSKELKIPIVVLAQLNRDSEKVHRKHQLSDLRESGRIGQEANVVTFLYREDMFDDDPDVQNIAEIYLAKHRGGPLGESIRLYFDKPIQTFRPLFEGPNESITPF